MIQRKKKKCLGCGKESYLFGKQLCQYCYNKEQIKQKKLKLLEPKKKKSLTKEDRKLAAKRNYAYKKARIHFLESKDHCEVALPDCLVPYPVYDKSELQVHHKRGRIDDLLTDERYFLCVCGNCHRYIEDHPQWAKENGYSLSRFLKD